MKIEQFKKPVYEMELHIYSVALCGKDLSGEPVVTSCKCEDVCELKKRAKAEILKALDPYNLSVGDCFIEITITKNGEYFDRDEEWASVNQFNRTVEFFTRGVYF